MSDSPYFMVKTYDCPGEHPHTSMCTPMVAAHLKPDLPKWTDGSNNVRGALVEHVGHPYVFTGRAWKKITWMEAYRMTRSQEKDPESTLWDG